VAVTRVRAFAAASLTAAGAWLVARWLAMQLAFSPGVTGIAAFAAAWVALYPLARLNRAIPAWMHWARGAFVLIVYSLFTLFAK
jgi:hypothetical protein